MTAILVSVPVPGADDLMAAQFDGYQWASLRHMCDSLGIDYATQLRKLKVRSWATVGQRPTVATDGKTRDMVMVDSRTIPMWLATIDENRVSPEARPKLMAYQREAADALDGYFNQRRAAPSMNQLDVLRAALDQIEAAQQTAQQAKAIADRVAARLDGIEGKHNWFSALAYARWNKLPTGKNHLQNLGKKAASLARAEGIDPERIQHDRFGWVNSFPEWIWNAVVDD